MVCILFANMKTMNCGGKLIDLSKPKVMGILNLTPDSFYDGSKYSHSDAALFQMEKMLNQGADIIDVGAMSSKPGSKVISIDEELHRIIKPLILLKDRFPDAIISVDTLRSAVAAETLAIGAHIINDISSGTFDKEMISVVAKYHAPFIAMHMVELPEVMQHNPQYNHVVNEVYQFLKERIKVCRDAGINDVIIDPGFGFGKTTSHNFALLKNLEAFKHLGCALLVGISRKSMLTGILNISAKEALNGTSAANTIALMNGAQILRVHDVKEAVECCKIFQACQEAEFNQ